MQKPKLRVVFLHLDLGIGAPAAAPCALCGPSILTSCPFALCAVNNRGLQEEPSSWW